MDNRANSVDQKLIVACKYYTAGKYSEAFQEFIEIQHTTDEKRLLGILGIIACYLQEDKKQAAIDYLTRVLTQTKFQLTIKTQFFFYASSIACELGDTVQAEVWLIKLKELNPVTYAADYSLLTANIPTIFWMQAAMRACLIGVIYEMIDSHLEVKKLFAEANNLNKEFLQLNEQTIAIYSRRPTETEDLSAEANNVNIKITACKTRLEAILSEMQIMVRGWNPSLASIMEVIEFLDAAEQKAKLSLSILKDDTHAGQHYRAFELLTLDKEPYAGFALLEKSAKNSFPLAQETLAKIIIRHVLSTRMGYDGRVNSHYLFLQELSNDPSIIYWNELDASILGKYKLNDAIRMLQEIQHTRPEIATLLGKLYDALENEKRAISNLQTSLNLNRLVAPQTNPAPSTKEIIAAKKVPCGKMFVAAPKPFVAKPSASTRTMKPFRSSG